VTRDVLLALLGLLSLVDVGAHVIAAYKPPPEPVAYSCACDLEGERDGFPWDPLVSAVSTATVEQVVVVPAGAACGGPLRIRPHLR
jgi:hypothetical protein